MNALLAGATGLIGREVSRAWPSGQGTLHLLLRRPLATVRAGQQAQVVDFAALPTLPRAEVALCCLGTTIAVAGSQAAFKAVDWGAVLAFAQAARQAGVKSFGLVSALGADSASRSFYSRVKGQTEEALQALNFETLVIARPSLLAGDRASLGQAPRTAERLALSLMKPLSALIPLAWRPIEARTVALALLRSTLHAQPGLQVLSSAALQKIGAGPDL